MTANSTVAGRSRARESAWTYTSCGGVIKGEGPASSTPSLGSCSIFPSRPAPRRPDRDSVDWIKRLEEEQDEDDEEDGEGRGRSPAGQGVACAQCRQALTWVFIPSLRDSSTGIGGRGRRRGGGNHRGSNVRVIPWCVARRASGIGDASCATRTSDLGTCFSGVIVVYTLHTKKCPVQGCSFPAWNNMLAGVPRPGRL